MNKGSQIVYGGGWRDKPTESRLKAKAWGTLFAAIIGGAIASQLDESAWAVWLAIPSIGLLVVSGILFVFERPRIVGHCGDRMSGDLDKLYASGGHLEGGPPPPKAGGDVPQNNTP